MASGGKSAVSLHGICGDTIPKEYHRRVLKKIAQLTKVVYSLHTKNDENEERIEALTAECLKDKQHLELELDRRLKERNEERNKNQDLEARITDLRREKDTLLIEHSAFVDNAEQRLQSLMEHNGKELTAVTSQVNQLKNQLTEKDKECSDLQKHLTRVTDNNKSKESRLTNELEILKQQNRSALEQFQRDLCAMKTSHEQAVTHLTNKHEEDIQSLHDTVSNKIDAAAQSKLQSVEEKCRSLEMQLASRESAIQDRLSTLSAELSKTKDDLAISQQKERDLEIALKEETRLDKEGRGLLEKEQQLVLDLQRKLTVLETDMSLLKDTREMQNEEMRKMNARAGELEATKIKLEKDGNILRFQLDEVTQKLKNLEEKRKTESDGYKHSSDEMIHRVHALEEEVEKLSQEKKHLHAQYAREIEAAHSSLSENEAALVEKHATYVHQLQNQHQVEMEALRAEKEREINALVLDYQSRMLAQESTATTKYHEDVRSLSASLAGKTKEASDLRDEVDSVRAILSERESELRSANASIDKQKKELTAIKQEAIKTKEQKDVLQTNTTQLQVSLDSLRSNYGQLLVAHREELSQIERHVKSQTEELWRNRMMSELAVLRNELDSQHNENKMSALKKMAQLSEVTLKDCETKWFNENNKLLQQIKVLEKELEDLKVSSKAELLQVEVKCRQQIDELKVTCDQQLTEADQLKQELLNTHSNEIEMLKKTLEGEKQQEIADIKMVHQQDVLAACQANHAAMEVVKNKLEKKREEEIEQLMRDHQQQMDDLEHKLNEDLELKLKTVQLQHDNQRMNSEKAARAKIDSLNFEISNHKNFQASLETQLSDCKDEISKMRQKLSLLSIELSDKKKQVEIKEKEIQMTITEAKTELKMQKEQLNAVHHAEFEAMICQHRHQSQLIINEFNKAKEILTKKLNSTEKRLHEAELKYKNRDPRPEDIAAIKELTAMVQEQERRMKDLIMEKKVYQMELFNREKNYNKVFNANPQIGVIDPLKGKRKPPPPSLFSMSASAARHSSSSSFTPSKNESNSLPNITSISTVDYARTPQLCRTPPPSLTSNCASVLQDSDPLTPIPGLSPSPNFHHHIPLATSSPSPSTMPGKRKLKFLSSGGNEPPLDRPKPKDNGVPLQASFTSSILA